MQGRQWTKVRHIFSAALRILLPKILLLVTFPIAVVVLLLRPWVLIRFGTLRGSRIGHFAAETEAYVLELQSHSRTRVIDLIACPEPVCNRQLEAMWRRTFPITPQNRLFNRVIQTLERSCLFLTQSSAHSVELSDRSSEHRLFMDTVPSLTFTEAEESQGKQKLRELGLPPDAEWVCIHNRDSAYLDTTYGKYSWAYHDYRDYEVESMLAAAEELARRGYYVLRVGAVVKEPLCSSNPRIIDYSISPLRSDFLDMYLPAHAKFFLGSDAGIFCVPMIFRRPIALTNFCYLEDLYEKDYDPFLFMPKRIRDSRTGNLLTLRETLRAGLGDALKVETFSAAGAEPVNNSSAEICDLAVEVDDRLKGTWQVDQADDELQRQFWSIFDEHAHRRSIGSLGLVARDTLNRRARIGSGFLRRHPDFLR